jgi:transposase InsO family protein
MPQLEQTRMEHHEQDNEQVFPRSARTRRALGFGQPRPAWIAMAGGLVDPARLSDRAKRDADLRPHIQRVFDANWQVYGVRKVWRQLRREGFDVARCAVARLMKAMGIQGVIRGKPHKTTIPDKKLPCPLDRVNRHFRVPAPNMLWVSDFTYVATWKGFVYVAFVIDAYDPDTGCVTRAAVRHRRPTVSKLAA